jgi:hypothetical protein
MSRVSTIARLPFEVRDEVDKRLIGNGFSDYDQIAKELHRRGFRVSRSGLHRYGQQMKQNIQIARARAQIEEAGVDPKIAAELAGETTLVIVLDRRNGHARLVNVNETPAAVMGRLKRRK